MQAKKEERAGQQRSPTAVVEAEEHGDNGKVCLWMLTKKHPAGVHPEMYVLCSSLAFTGIGKSPAVQPRRGRGWRRSAAAKEGKAPARKVRSRYGTVRWTDRWASTD